MMFEIHEVARWVVCIKNTGVRSEEGYKMDIKGIRRV